MPLDDPRNDAIAIEVEGLTKSFGGRVVVRDLSMRVRRGQMLASLGFSGDSTEPHLHFHVADDPSPLSGEGLPFEFDRFRVHAGGVPRVRERERPAPNAVVSFD